MTTDAFRAWPAELLADAHRRGQKVFVFTVNRPAEIASLAAPGADGVFTDYPDRVVTFQREQSKIVR